MATDKLLSTTAGSTGALDNLPASLRPDALIDIKTVQGMMGLHSSTPIYNRLREGNFPEPIRLSARCTRWRVSAIQEWLKEQESE